MEVRFTEPALDLDRHRPSFFGGAIGRGQRLGAGRQLVERGVFDRFARLDDHDRGLGAGRDRFGHRPEQVRLAVGTAWLGRCAHDHQVRLVGLAQDGVADVRRLADDGLAATGDVLLDERRQGALGLGPNCQRDIGRDEVEDDDRGVVMACDRVGEMERQFRVGAATDRNEDPLDDLGATLLDDRDVAR